MFFSSLKVKIKMVKLNMENSIMNVVFLVISPKLPHYNTQQYICYVAKDMCICTAHSSNR